VDPPSSEEQQCGLRHAGPFWPQGLPHLPGSDDFGTAAGFGVNDARARPIIDAYLDAGHNFIDTAGNSHAGQSEEIVGRAVRGKRDAVVIATKPHRRAAPAEPDRL
jgi:aryl-alcohol dehydrogenase-like predicted oxidoreductase